MGRQLMICSNEDLLMSATSMFLVVLCSFIIIETTWESLMKRLMMDSFLDTLQWLKPLGYSTSEGKKWKKTYHITFSEDDEAIAQTNTEGDKINFNENRSFPDNKFLVPRSKIPLSSGKDDYFPYFSLVDDHPVQHEPDESEPAKVYSDSFVSQDITINEPISEAEPLLTITSPSADVIHDTPAP
ncbi:hypothetical protein Tco_1134572 [Tanacetum coccineum]